MLDSLSTLTREYLRRYHRQSFPAYEHILEEACEIHPPPHATSWYGNLYRQLACNSDWFVQSLIANIYAEAQGSAEAWEFSYYIYNLEFSQLVREHALDEARHAQIFLLLLDTLFPNKIEANFRQQLKTLCPDYDGQKNIRSVEIFLEEETVIDCLIRTNLLEIRALILQLLLRPVLLAYTSTENLVKVTQISDILIADETRHIEYTAYCINEYIDRGKRDWVRAKIIDHQAFINQFCLDELRHSGVLDNLDEIETK